MPTDFRMCVDLRRRRCSVIDPRWKFTCGSFSHLESPTDVPPDMFEPIRGGTRGGQAEFKWADVSADKDREVCNRSQTQEATH